jgi:methionyl-tRNA formyltransferase
VDIDYFYDSAIRADIMADVVAKWQRGKQFDEITAVGDGADHYVIHPLLKHLALLSIDRS